MFDLPERQSVMSGVCMELEDCAFKALSRVEVHTNPESAFSDCDVIVMLANAMLITDKMTRSDLFIANRNVYSHIADILRQNANKDLKILAIANPANTNALVLFEKLKDVIPSDNITSLTRLNHNRTQFMVANHLGVLNDHVRKIIVWGNHSNTMVPDLRFAEVKTSKGWESIQSVLKDPEWIPNSLVPGVRYRYVSIIKTRGKSSSLSAATAAIDHLRNWLVGTDPDDWVSMGVYTEPAYSAIPSGVFYGQPCRCENGKFSVVKDLEIDPETHNLMKISGEELLDEKRSIFS